MRSPTLWATVNQCPALVKFQAIVRGRLVRKRIAQAGPGVLCRQDLANEEDFATCLDVSRIHPMEYFGFEENGKRWGFLFESLWRWSIRSVTPTNPYTKVPLSKDTRIRLRTIWMHRFRQGIPREVDSDNSAERARYRWTVLCQHFADAGFTTVDLETLVRFTTLELGTMFVLLERDLDTTLAPSDPFRTRLLSICRRRIEDVKSSMWCANSLLYMVSLPADSYGLTFTILSALYRC